MFVHNVGIEDFRTKSHHGFRLEPRLDDRPSSALPIFYIRIADIWF
jgi:hypothetical protein